MKHGKKLLGIFLSVVMLLGLLPTSALAAGTTWSGTIDAQNLSGTQTIYVDGRVTVSGNINISANADITIIGRNGAELTSSANDKNSMFNLDSPVKLTLQDITIESPTRQDYTGDTFGIWITQRDNSSEIVLNNAVFKVDSAANKEAINWVGGTLTLQGNTHAEGTGIFISRGMYCPQNMQIDISDWTYTGNVQMEYRRGQDYPDPYWFATGAANSDKSKFSCIDGSGTALNTYYLHGNLWVGSPSSSEPDDGKWEVNLGKAPTGCTVTGGTMRQLVTKTEAMINVTIDPGEGKTFAGVDISSPFTPTLSAAGLRTELVDGKLVIKGMPTKDVDLSSAIWPNPVSNTKRITLGTELPAGVELVTGDAYGDLTQNITNWNEFKPVVLRATADYMFSSGAVNALNTQFEGIELTAELNSAGDIEIKYSGKGAFNTIPIDKNIKNMSLTVDVIVTVTDRNDTVKKYTSLHNAAEAVRSGETVTLKKASTTTGNSRWIMKSNVTLVDLNGNSYKSADGEPNVTTASIAVTNDGKVSLQSGKLKVTPSDTLAENETASVTVETSGSSSTTVSGRDAFIVTAAKGTGDGSADNDKATVTIPTEGKSVTTGTGLTFTAGAANSTFPLDGSTLTNDGDSVKIGAGKTAEVEVGADTTSIKVKVPAASKTNTGAVTVTKGGGSNAAATVTVEKAGDKFTVGTKTYTAAENGTTFAIDANGNVKLTSGSITLADGESATGTVSGKTIENPAGSGNDSVTVAGVSAAGSEAAYDKVTVPKGGSGSVKIVNDGTYYNKSENKDLILKVTQSGVSVLDGEITMMLDEGHDIVGTTSGVLITNPLESGNDKVEVTSDNGKDRVTVPKNGAGQTVPGSVIIGEGDAAVTYTNGDAEKDLIIDVTAGGGASLSSGSVKLGANKAIGVNGKTITNTSTTPITVKKDDGSIAAVIDLSDGQSFSDAEGNKYTANGGSAAFELDDEGNITLLAGSATVEPAEGTTPTVNVRKTPNFGETYPVSGNKSFTVTVGDNAVKSTVTVPTKDESVTSGDLTFTAGANNAIFPLDGSKLNNVGDKLTVAPGKTAEVEVGEIAGEGESPATPIKVKVPADGNTNSGATTITKGQPTIVKIGVDGDSFSVNGNKVPEQGYTTKAGEEYAINMTTGAFEKVTARLYDANGKEINAGSVYSMIRAATGGQTVKMEKPSEGRLETGLHDGVTLIDTDGNAYKAVGDRAAIRMVANTDDVDLNSGTLTVTPATDKTAGVAVAKNPSSRDYTIVSGKTPFTVTVGKGNGSGVGEGNDKSTVTIPTTGKTVTVGGSADTGMVFTAGAANSTFPLDGSKLSNVGDSVKFGANHTSTAQVDAGNGNSIDISNNVAATVKKVSGGHTVTLDDAGKSFAHSYPVGEGTGSVRYTAAADDTTFFVGDDGKTALVSGAVKVSQTDSTDVRPNGWSKSVSVSVPEGGSDVTVSVSGTPAKGKAAVDNGKSVTIGDKTYTAAAADTAFAFDEDGNVKLDSGKAALDKDKSILGGISGVEIKNTGAESITDPVIVEKTTDKDIVTVPAGGKVTIGGKEYTANGGEMKLEIGENGKVTLNSGKADFGKDTSLNLNGAEIKNTGNSALTMTENSSADTLDVAQGGSFTVGTGEVKASGEDMRFTIESDGSLTANLTDGKSVTINGVTYTGGETGAALKLDKDGNLAISGSYTANVPGKTSYKVNGKVTKGGSAVAGAIVKLTQGGKETFRIASVTTDAQGNYEFAGVPSGVYNLVVTKDDQTVTKLVTVENGNVVMDDIAMPTGSVSSIVDVQSSSPVGAMAGGLDAIASVDATGGTVKYTLTISGGTEDASIAAHEDAQGKTMLYLDIDLSKTVDGSPASFDNTQILEILLTFDTSNKRDIVVFHKDGPTVTALTKIDARPAADSFTEGTYYVGSGYVAVYTSKFSPYAIGYKEVVSSGGSSSGSSANVAKTQNGSVSVSPKSARKGETVTITVKPDAGYKLGTLTVTDRSGNKLALTKVSDTQYTYVAPGGRVDIKAEFVKLGTDYASCAKDSSCPIAAFADAKPTAWYHDGMHYCLDNGLMNGFGNGNIGPDHPTSRAQVVVMLWRLSGSPVVNYALDFDDVAEGTWYTEAIRWAKSTGVADGYGNGSFGPADTITREQIVTILYRYAQNNGYDVSVGESTNILSFADATTVSEFAFPAMQWACGSGMVNGVDGANGTVNLLPQGDTDRAQMATMLMRFCVEIAK